MPIHEAAAVTHHEVNAQVSLAGKLGYVQPVGAGPAGATADSTVEYGVGGYLLAGSEVAKLLP
jgi:unsaturated rhamnogalacturonyl hydrolase